MKYLKDKKVLITGGGYGIGRLMCIELLKSGAIPIIWDISETNLSETITLLKDQGEIYGYLCDVSNADQVEQQAQIVKEEIGTIDILINNAGTVNGKTFMELNNKEIERIFAINTLSLYYVTRPFMRDMITSNSGHIVTIASAAGLMGIYGLSDYSASKHAAVGFTESIRAELRESAPHVKTTVICPYFINTGLFDGAKTRFSFLLPILNDKYVAKKIVKAIKNKRSRLWMPKLVYIIPIMRLLPTWIFDAVAHFLGVHKSMQSFKGRH